MKVGVIGHGVVGSAVAKAFATKLIYDKYKPIRSINDVSTADVIFVSVPTPTTNGTQDLSALTDVLQNLSALNCRAIVVVKCTVLPGTMDQMQLCYPNLKLAHNPEFLTERRAYDDFIEQPTVLLSGSHLMLVIACYQERFRYKPILSWDKFKTTEMAKYIHNCFLATKVAFMNEIYEYCSRIDADHSTAVMAALSQEVIGDSHTRVPGPDGKLGFGGACFVKDTNALLSVAPELTIMKAAVEANKRVRPTAYDGTEKCGVM